MINSHIKTDPFRKIAHPNSNFSGRLPVLMITCIRKIAIFTTHRKKYTVFLLFVILGLSCTPTFSASTPRYDFPLPATKVEAPANPYAFPTPLFECFSVTAPGMCRNASILTSGIEMISTPFGNGPLIEHSQRNPIVMELNNPSRLINGTMSMWVKHQNDFLLSDVQILGKFTTSLGSDVDNDPHIDLGIRTGKVEGHVGNDQAITVDLNTSEELSMSPILPGEWHQYTFTWDTNEIRLYIDGGLMTKAERNDQGFEEPFDTFYLGICAIPDCQTDSQFSKLIVYGEKLTQPQIQYELQKDLFAHRNVAEVYISRGDVNHQDYLDIIAGSLEPVLEYHLVLNSTLNRQGKILFALPHNQEEFVTKGFQTLDPSSDNYFEVIFPTGVFGQARCYKATRLPSSINCLATINSGEVSPQQEVIIRLKNVRVSPHTTISHKESANTKPKILVDTGEGTPLGGILLPQDGVPPFFLHPSNVLRQYVFLRLPSTIDIGEPFSIKIWAEREGLHPDLDSRFTLVFDPVNGLEGLPITYDFEPDFHGSAEIKNLVFRSPPGQNPVRIAARVKEDNTIVVNVNPVEVMNSTSDHISLYWGDLHTHSSYSDGREDPRFFYSFARSRGLDFAGLTDHVMSGDVYAMPWEFNHILGESDWEGVLQDIARNHNIPGEFISFLGYEFSSGRVKDLQSCNALGMENCSSVEGDWNIIFSKDDVPFVTSDYLVNGVENLISKIIPIDPQAIIIPHYGGRRANLDLIGQYNLDQLVPVVEIMSNHASSPQAFESWAVTPLVENHNLRYGFVGGSDDHSTHPGRSQWKRRIGGYMAVWATDLSRESLLSAIKQRHVYAYSTGDRPIIRVIANQNKMMGDEVSLGGNEKPRLTIKISSQSRVESYIIMKNGLRYSEASGTSEFQNGAYYTEFTYEDPLFSNDSFYYLVIIFEESGTAITSPIWFRSIEMPFDHPVYLPSYYNYASPSNSEIQPIPAAATPIQSFNGSVSKQGR